MPFLNSDYISEVLHIFPHEQYFAEKYLKEIFKWIRKCINTKIQCTKNNYLNHLL